MSGTPAGGRGLAGRAAQVAALQAALAAEHAAVYGYGVAGARLTGRARAHAQRDWAQHQAARDTLSAMLTALRATPAVTEVVYRLPFPVHDARAATALAAYLEDQVAAGYLGLVALADARLRDFGARGVEAAALRATAWRGRSVAFPGLTGTQVSRLSRGGKR